MHIYKIILIVSLLTFDLSCKSPPHFQEDENTSELDAINVASLWNWFGRYADNIAQYFSKFEKTAPDIRRLSNLSLIPNDGVPEVAKILKQNMKNVPKLAAKLASLNHGELKLHEFPLKSLPDGIPSKYQRAFQVLFNSMKEAGSGKIAARRFSSQIVQKFSQTNKISSAEAYERHLIVFTRTEFGVSPMPLPDKFVDANLFYGHMIKNQAPFLDVAFGPGGVLGPDSETPGKAAHGVYVHIEDFFEWSVLCKISDCGGVSMAELMRYIARSGLAETAVATLKQKDAALAAGKTVEAAKLEKQLSETMRILSFHADGRELKALSRGEQVSYRDPQLGIDIPVKILDWASKTELQNGTNLWDVFFDFQNLADEAFKDFQKLQPLFGNPPPGFLASSMNVASNPMFMGKTQVLNVFFNTLGWH